MAVQAEVAAVAGVGADEHDGLPSGRGMDDVLGSRPGERDAPLGLGQGALSREAPISTC